MSFGGLIASLLGLGIACGKSSLDMARRPKGIDPKYFWPGWDPLTEYKIACQCFKEVMEYRESIEDGIREEIETLPWKEIKERYADYYANYIKYSIFCRQRSTDYMDNDKSAQDFFRQLILMRMVIEDKIVEHFGIKDTRTKDGFYEGDAKEFVATDILDIYPDGRYTFEKSIAAHLAGYKMRRKGFYHVYETERNFWINIVREPTQEDIDRALRALEISRIPLRRDGAAGSTDGLTEQERKRKSEGFWSADRIIYAVVITWGLFLVIAFACGWAKFG